MDWATIIFGSVAFLVQYYTEQFKKLDLSSNFPVETPDYSFPRIESYDFIIVGGGTAGCLIASRLSQNPIVRVLVLESGGNPAPQSDIPAFAPHSLGASNIIFDYHSRPQAYANNIVLRAPVGKVLGGTSAINYMVYNRGNPRDYNAWANASGDDSWSYGPLLEYYKRSENYQGQFPLNVHHGTRGPVTVSSQSYAPGLFQWLEAGREKGYSMRDPNGPQVISFSPVEYTKSSGKRVSSFDAFIKPFEQNRPNLKVIRYAHVTEILLDAKNRAYGLTYKKHEVYKGVLASKEIILCAGTYGSPQLLMRSGIGPADHLRGAKIDTKVDSPHVGQYLQDHPQIPLRIDVKEKSIRFDPDIDLDENTLDAFMIRGIGPLTSTYSLSGQAFLVSSVAKSEGKSDWPDIQLSLYSQSRGLHVFPDEPDDPHESPAIFIFPHLTRPKSRGWITLDPEDVHGPPIIDFNFLHDRRDILILTDAINMALEIFDTTKVYNWAGASFATSLDACNHLPFRSDGYWDCYIRSTIIGGNNPVGTCAMGFVVDSKLRVRGVKGLRVVDASVIPVIINTDVQAAVYAIAEKASDEIKSHWRI